MVATPDIMSASWGLSPSRIGKIKVPPNMAMTCWAPSPAVRGQESRWFGATISPGRRVLPSP